jgi:hypothetical protein
VASRRQTRQCLIDFGGQQPASLEFLGEKTQLETRAGDFSDQAVNPQCRLLMRKLSQWSGMLVQSISNRSESAGALRGRRLCPV